MNKRYIVTLTVEERNELRRLVARGKGAARKLTHARILLKADIPPEGPGWSDEHIAHSLDVHRTTVEDVRKRFVLEGVEAALNRRPPKREYRRKLDGRGEAQLVTLACSRPPEGHARWTLRLLAEQMVELEYVDSLGPETVRRTLKKTQSSHG
jgi:transposase